MVVVFGALAVLADRGSFPIAAPQAGVLLVPVALGTAISAAAALAAFDLDVRGGSFGWKQPLGILASVAVVVGIVPGVMALADGSFQTPTTPLAKLIDASLPDADATGDYNVLLIGDARLLPVPSTEYRDGVSWAIIDDGALDARDRWMPPSNGAAELITTALDEVSASSTLRAGRLLAPLGIRYVVMPEFDGVVSTVDDPLPTPVGLVSSMEDQLDLVARATAPDARGVREPGVAPDDRPADGLGGTGEPIGGTRGARAGGSERGDPGLRRRRPVRHSRSSRRCGRGARRACRSTTTGR